MTLFVFTSKGSLDTNGFNYYLQQTHLFLSNSPDSTYKYCELAYGLAANSQDSSLISKAMRYQAEYHVSINKFPTAIGILHKAIQIDFNHKNERGLASDYNRIGAVYFRKGDFENAEEYFNQSYILYQRLKDLNNQALVLTNIGSLNAQKLKYLRAIECYQKSEKVYIEMSDSNNLAATHFNIASCYFKLDTLNKFDSSSVHYQLAYEIYAKINNNVGVGKCLLGLGEVAQGHKLFKEAENHFLEALRRFRQSKSLINVRICYAYLSDLFLERNDHKAAYNWLERYYELDDSLFGQEVEAHISELEIKYRTEQNERKIAEQNLEILGQKSELGVKNGIGIALMVAVLLLIIIAIIVTLRYREKIAANQIISVQKTTLQLQNQRFTDSISYAKNIQKALLPSHAYIRSLLGDYFLLYKPKDIVSGDFYWIHEHAGKIIFALADCTGHGVPGAFMSMLGNSLLNEIVITGKTIDPKEILNQLRVKITYALQQKEDSLLHYDGMDISLGVLDSETGELTYAGAFSPLYIVTEHTDYYEKEHSECAVFTSSKMPGIGLIEVKGNPQPVGKYYTYEKPFTDKTFTLQQNDMIYLFTDGIVDQIGGSENSKFMIPPFRELLLTLSQESTDVQHSKILDIMDKWIQDGNRKQMDDISMLGVRFKR